MPFACAMIGPSPHRRGHRPDAHGTVHLAAVTVSPRGWHPRRVNATAMFLLADEAAARQAVTPTAMEASVMKANAAGHR